MKSLYISRAIIKNYRNFKYADIKLDHKQVIIGENNIGKTNLLRALQLILDPTLSDDDRYLEESDFYNGIKDPMGNKEIIEIKIYISNYTNNKNILAQFSDATIKEGSEEKLLITYRYFPIVREDGQVEYEYIIFKGKNEQNRFIYSDRRYLNLKVIKALRDVEIEMKNSKTSPINKILKNYSIDNNELNEIADKLEESGSQILDLDEITDLVNNINTRFTNILGNKNDFTVSLKTMDIDPTKLIYSLKLFLSDRSISDISLGLNNILYISLVLLLIQDTTIPTYIKRDKFEELKEKDEEKILDITYDKNDKENYFIKKDLSIETMNKLYNFMEIYEPRYDGVTILAIEEPESHLHPTYQRLIYKEVIRKSNNSVLLTTHSTHVTSISPIKSIVHLHRSKQEGTKISTTTELNLLENELADLERYIDIKRGEIYMGRGVILVEGITEEYLVPKFADLLGQPLDEKGIIVCNINSTNFKPYVKLLRKLEIPFVVITDGDFYYKELDKGKIKKVFHTMINDEDDRELGYLGHDIIKEIILDLGIIPDNEIPDNFQEQDNLFRNVGFYVGYYTFEVDMMEACAEDINSKNIIIKLFDTLTDGGNIQKKNFKEELENGDYWKCLRKIDGNGIGKGRFAQRMSQVCLKEHIPGYISDAIEDIYTKVDEL
ncbi:ATP-dependent nuclease [Senegalia sp. (in: firmicutes)]|uniref:ATP-dependent nuclease n=2 Tax=Senegalia sp. (in: firmicutes) TaxID=1924098 RepID=UPI003F99BDA8